MPKIRIEAPEGVDPLVIAQAVVGEHVLLKATPKPSWTERPFVIWQPLQEMYQEQLAAYQDVLARLEKAILKATGADKLEKAVVDPVLTLPQVREVAKLIHDYHTAFLINLGAGSAVDPDEVRRLVKEGILPKKVMNIIEDSYLYGQMVASIRELSIKENLKSISYKSFKKKLKKHPIALSLAEKEAIEWSKESAATHVNGHANKMADDFSKAMTTASAEKRKRITLREVIREEMVDKIEDRKTVRKLASELAHRTGDYARDFQRIAATETQTAFQEGFVASLVKNEARSPKHLYVAKIPKPDACPDCERLHLTAGFGSAPQVFRLSELIGNGTNRGRKRKQWLPVVGTVHPWCACEIVHVPEGWKFEDEPVAQTKGLKKVKGKKAWVNKKTGKPWRPKLLPDSLRRGDIFKRDLMKSFMSYGDSVPDKGVSIRVSDPEILREIEAVVHATPPELFDKDVGVTLITWDHPRPQVALNDHDLAYWTGNEIRISHSLTPDKVGKVMRHELGHALNVYLIRLWGSEAPVRKWHEGLYDIAKEEGFVSEYASTLPIECAAEATRLYLYDRQRLMLDYPKQFTFLHQVYRPIWRKHANLEHARVRAVEGPRHTLQ